MKRYYSLLAFLSLIILIISCTGNTKELASTATSAKGNLPIWFSTSGFSSDSIAFYGYGVGIAADSTDALERATIEAENNLSFHVGKLSEEIRRDMEKVNISASKNTDFILLLRNAHGSIMQFSEVNNSFLMTPEKGFRALVQINISKENAHQMFEQGFKGHPRYWAAFSGLESYKTTFLD